jgi:uncharacterized protein YndB with AHSA1/START domain
MAERIERELLLEASPTEVWQALTDRRWLTEWLADEVFLELRPGGEAWFRFGETVRSGWVEEISPPDTEPSPADVPPSRPGAEPSGRLAFWWADDDEPASRVELAVTAEEPGRTRLRVTETRPLEVLDLVGLRLPGPGGGTYGPALVAA